jgi:predicted O-linked N-acetylglucosamine transferase (SPINDLY family)
LSTSQQNAWAAEQVNAAVQLHQAGQLSDAEKAYRDILAKVPDYPDAYSLLGLVCLKTNRQKEALQLLNQALSLASHAVFFVNRSSIFLALEQHALAESDAKKALKLNPDAFDAYVNLISSLRSQKKLQKATEFGRKAIEKFPENADLWNNYAACLLDLGRVADARDAFVNGVKASPLHAVCPENIARIDWHEGRYESAMEFSQQAFDLGSVDPQVLVPWALHLIKIGKREASFPVFMKAVTHGQLISLKSYIASADFLNGVFATSAWLQKQKRADEASALLQRLAQCNPDSPDIWNNVGVSYFAAGQYAQALLNFEKANQLDNQRAISYRNMGVCQFLLLAQEDALVSFKRAYELESNSCTNLLYYFGQCLQCCEWENIEQLRTRLVDFTLESTPDDLTASLAYLMAVEKASDMKAIAAKVGNSLFRNQLGLDNKEWPKPLLVKRKRIRIGYYSYDFRNHPVSYLTQELYGLHDRSRFEVFALSYGPNDGSEWRQGVERDVDHFVELHNLPLPEMARRIKLLELDIVVDLTGNTQGGLSSVMAYRIAPIQCHWLGYVWSMGQAVFDYTLGDPFSIPPHLEFGYVEKIARLPYTMQINSRRLKASARVLTRKEMGLPEDAFVFANFGSFSKILPVVFGVWMNALKAVPNSVLWLARTNRTPVTAFKRLQEAVRMHGVSADRVIYSEPMSREDHLHRYELADLALDTYPQGSGTTAIEALWMGCPMLSMAGAGETLAIRMAGSVLNAVGLEDLVVDSAQAYEQLAIELGNDRSRVKSYRQHLQDKRLTLPLFDTPRVVSYLEYAYETMISIAHEGGAPRSFDVPA